MAYGFVANNIQPFQLQQSTYTNYYTD